MYASLNINSTEALKLNKFCRQLGIAFFSLNMFQSYIVGISSLNWKYINRTVETVTG